MKIIIVTLLLLSIRNTRAGEDGEDGDAQVSCTSSYNPSYYNKTTKNWSVYPTNSCPLDKPGILKLCQRIYKNKIITNIVESNHNIRINFCSPVKPCKKFWTKPYRCLETPFQSDALLVPSPCVFDHVHNASVCKENWNGTAAEICESRGMRLKSFAVLLPCGVGVFTGVEFVCCPLEDDEEDYDDYAETTTTTPSVDQYFKRYDVYNERQNYLDAEERLEDTHKTRINKVMNDWNELEAKYQKMVLDDPKGAEEFKKTVTGRFQKTVKALEDEGMAEKRQLLAVHQQRLASHLNERKKEAMECYTKGLNERPLDPLRIRKCLERLMRALHKERHLVINGFKHNKDLREVTLERLGSISNTARESLKLLERHPLLSSIKSLINDYVSSLQGHDDFGSLLETTKDSDIALLDKLEGITSTTTEAATTTTEETAQLFYNEKVDNSHVEVHEFQHDVVRKTFTIHRETLKDDKVYITMSFAGLALFGALVTGLILFKKKSPRSQGFLAVSNEYVASPEEKHVVNMQVNGYENPTYKFFEK